MKDATDLKLEALLKTPSRAPDEGFVLRTRQAVLIERKLAALRRAAWTRFGWEMAAAAAAIAAFWLLARAAPGDSVGVVTAYSPAAAGLLLLVLWLIVSLKPSASRDWEP